MKKLAIAVALGWAGLAAAGEYHVNAALVCSDCHTMHASRTHQFGSTAADTVVGTSATPHKTLLIADGELATCLACHDGQTFAPDVYAADANTTNNRSAGALNGAASLAATHSNGTYDTFMGHTMAAAGSVLPPGIANATDWYDLAATDKSGNPAPLDEEFACGDCHAVHGSASYRNLGNTHGRPAALLANGPTSKNVRVNYVMSATFDATKDVTVNAAGRGTPFATSKYSSANITFGIGANGVNTTAYGMNEFCGGCHGNYHQNNTTAGGNVYDVDGDVIRHPTTTANRQLNTSGNNGTLANAQFGLVRPLWQTSTQGSTGTFDVGCLSCHRAHGSANAFGLIIPAVQDNTTLNGRASGLATTDLENGTIPTTPAGNVRGLCVTCHGMGTRGAFPVP